MSSKIIILIVLIICFYSAGLLATDHAESRQPLTDIGEAFPLYSSVCSFVGDSDFGQVDKAEKVLDEWFDESGTEIFRSRLVPLFRTGAKTYDYINLEADTFETFGKDWSRWTQQAKAKAISEVLDSVSDCQSGVSAMYPMYRNDKQVNVIDERIVVVNWCSRKSGLSADQMIAKHREFRNSIAEPEFIFWGIAHPILGFKKGDFPGDFYHLMVYPDMEALARRENISANEEGWRSEADYYDNFADCSGEIVFTESVRRWR
ncbi:hypothetical protein OAL14_04225 [Gammaproteobacteria bacterium]|nr:hypothetical protein [Gammaproteobacteria bacterium]